jgi:hypothetical protein
VSPKKEAPKSGAPTEADAHFWAFLNVSSGFPVKEPSFKVPYKTVVSKFEWKGPVLRCLHKCADDSDVCVRGTEHDMNGVGVSRA